MNDLYASLSGHSETSVPIFPMQQLHRALFFALHTRPVPTTAPYIQNPQRHPSSSQRSTQRRNWLWGLAGRCFATRMTLRAASVPAMASTTWMCFGRPRSGPMDFTRIDTSIEVFLSIARTTASQGPSTTGMRFFSIC